MSVSRCRLAFIPYCIGAALEASLSEAFADGIVIGISELNFTDDGEEAVLNCLALAGLKDHDYDGSPEFGFLLRSPDRDFTALFAPLAHDVFSRKVLLVWRCSLVVNCCCGEGEKKSDRKKI